MSYIVTHAKEKEIKQEKGEASVVVMAFYNFREGTRESFTEN